MNPLKHLLLPTLLAILVCSWGLGLVLADASPGPAEETILRPIPLTATTTLAETFNLGTLPTGWTVMNAIGAVEWRFDDHTGRGNNTGGDGNFAIADGTGQTEVDAELRTPSMNLTGQAIIKLKFKTQFKSSARAVVDVDVSIDGESTWVNVWRKRGTDVQGEYTVDLSAWAANQPNVVLRFRQYYQDKFLICPLSLTPRSTAPVYR